MKKLVASLLAVSLLASLSIPALAATNDGTADTNINVDGIYRAGAAAADSISVDVTWDAMDFTYTAGSKGIWNPETHTYDNPTAGTWAPTTGTAPKITLTNHSNVAVQANFDFACAVDGVVGSFEGLTDNALLLDSAVGTEADAAPNGAATFTVSGSAIDKDEDLGTITVTVAKYDTDAAYKVTAEQFKGQMENAKNFKLVMDFGDSSDGLTYYRDGTTFMGYNGVILIYTFDGENYYGYLQDEPGSDWMKSEIEPDEYDDVIGQITVLPYLKDSYEGFAYDEETKTYKSTGPVTITIPGAESPFTLPAVSARFENGVLKEATISFGAEGSYIYSEIGTTVIEIPTNIHEHTFAAEWSHDKTYHWHAATCRHTDEKKDEAEHTWENGVCTGCGLSAQIISEDGKTVTDYRDKDSTALVTVPEDVTTIGQDAYYNCSFTEIVFPKSLREIRGSAFAGSALQTVYYAGTESEWVTNILIYGPEAEVIEAAAVYYYSETEPTAEGNYWHYVDGTPTSWN